MIAPTHCGCTSAWSGARARARARDRARARARANLLGRDRRRIIGPSTMAACSSPAARRLVNGCVGARCHLLARRPGGFCRARAPSLQHLWTVCQRRRCLPRGVVEWPTLPLDEVLASCRAGERSGLSLTPPCRAWRARGAGPPPPARPRRSERISSTSYSSSSISATLCSPRWPAGRIQPSHSVHAPTHMRGVGWTCLDLLIRASAWMWSRAGQLEGENPRTIRRGGGGEERPRCW